MELHKTAKSLGITVIFCVLCLSYENRYSQIKTMNVLCVPKLQQRQEFKTTFINPNQIK